MTTEKRTPAAGERIGYYDALRVAAMIGVILIHVCAQAATDLAAEGQTLGIGWHAANLLDSLGRFAVPVYLMITGGAASREAERALRGFPQAHPARGGPPPVLDGGVSGFTGRNGTGL